MQPLTSRQHEVLSFVRTFKREHDFAPTQTEIAKHFGFAVNAARDHLDALEKKGALRITRKVARGLSVISSSPCR